MDLFDFSTFNSEKSTAIFRFNHLKTIAILFRIVEIFLGLVFCSWTFTRLPFAVKISGDYFRQFISIIVSPLFIFLICNVIVLTLLFKSGDIFSGATVPSSSSETELYEGFIKTSEDCCCGGLMNDISSPVTESAENEYQDKQTILEVSNGNVSIGNFSDVLEVPETVIAKKSDLKTYRRSQSEHLDMNRGECVEKENLGKLRRSETEKCLKFANPAEVPEDTVYIFDELSNEEFQQTIEDFIAKQIRFHQEEKLPIVFHGHMSMNYK